MRGLGLSAFARIATMTGASLAGLASMGAGVARFVRAPRAPGEERVDPKTARARAEGKRADPFFGIASKGRRGARERSQAMEAARIAFRKRRLSGRPHLSNPFKNEHRRAAYMASLRAGESHADAMKSARLILA